jgi:hypothetical protein
MGLHKQAHFLKRLCSRKNMQKQRGPIEPAPFIKASQTLFKQSLLLKNVVDYFLQLRVKY